MAMIRAVVSGSLRAMPPAEILQWLGGARKTGMLEVEHARVVRKLHFREGAIRSCGSDYAPTLLGQHLLSLGRIVEADLHAALAAQEGSGRNLGEILMASGLMSAVDLEQFVAAKIEETVYGLFDLEDGTFRFESGAEPPPGTVETDLSVAHVLLRGATREDELHRLREVIRDDEAVLERTGAELPGAVAASPVSRTIVELIDGQRCVREIVLHARAPEFLALRLLASLVRGGVLRVTGRAPSAAPSPRPAAVPRARVEAEVRTLLDADDPEAALRVLESAPRADTTVGALRVLRDEAESACFAHLFGRVLGSRRVPHVVRRPESCSPEDSFLLSLIDGRNDVRALVWLAPMRALAVVRTLKRLVDSGAVAVRDA